MEERSNDRLWASVLIFILVGVPAVLMRVLAMSVEPVAASLVYGPGIVAGAFLLSWGAEGWPSLKYMPYAPARRYSQAVCVRSDGP